MVNIRPLAMRILVIAIAILVTQAVMIDDAWACRGPFLSTKEIVRDSSSIFTAKITSRVPAGEHRFVVELRVTRVLKGTVPKSLSVNENALIHPNDFCSAIESGHAFPRSEPGEEWLVSGNFDTSHRFVPTTAGNFRLNYPGGTEDSARFLREFRKTISRMRTKSRLSAQ